MTFLLICCGERDVSLSLELAGDLATEHGLVVPGGQGDVGDMLELPAKIACLVCRASAFFGIHYHIGVDADSGLVHSVVTTATNVHELNTAPDRVHGDQRVIYGDSGHIDRDARWF